MVDLPTYQVDFVDGASVIHSSTRSAILRPDEYTSRTSVHIVSAATVEVYGGLHAGRELKIGNGGLGPTGVLRKLCETYLSQQDPAVPSEDAHGGKLANSDLEISWVANHSRHSQAALQASIVDVALTYEPEEEARAEDEGWSRRVGLLCYDHFILVGPHSDPAGLRRLQKSQEKPGLHREHSRAALAFRAIANSGSTFHTRGDGSATMHKEFALWNAAGL